MAGGSIVEIVQFTANYYGKVGVLVDDLEQTEYEIARCLYGAEELPRWWLVARTVTCGVDLLKAAIRVMRDEGDHRSCRWLLVVDRFLPISHAPGQGRPKAWDLMSQESRSDERDSEGNEIRSFPECEALESAVRNFLRLQTQNRDTVMVSLVTSYPYKQISTISSSDAIAREQEETLPWMARSLETFYDLRRSLSRGSRLAECFRYGPAADADGNYRRSTRFETIPQSILDETEWAARTWRAEIDKIANALNERGRNVLLITGAGVSLAPTSLSPGIPATAWILEEACREVAHRDPLVSPRGDLLRGDASAIPPLISRFCICGENQDTAAAPGEPESIEDRKAGTPIEFLIDRIGSGVSASQIYWDLELLFSESANSGNAIYLSHFATAFRNLLHRFDAGFLFHHLLLARLPFSRIITTNFDSFHERAAAESVGDVDVRPETQKSILSLGNPFPFSAVNELEAGRASTSSGTKDARRGFDIEEFRLYKPYGDLLSPGGLAISSDQLRSCQDRFRLALESALDPDRENWIIVLGHSMRDPFIDEILVQLNGPSKLIENSHLYWVVPEALQASRAGGNSPWLRWIQKRLGRWGTADLGAPLAATALEFVFDLWLSYRLVTG